MFADLETFIAHSKLYRKDLMFTFYDENYIFPLFMLYIVWIFLFICGL